MSNAIVGEPFLLSESGSTRATAYDMTNKSVRQYDMTHVTWLDAVSGIRVRSYNHKTRTWSDTVEVDEGCDNHGNPALAVTPDGYLRLAYGPHAWWNPLGGEPWHHGMFCTQQSVQPGDCSQWRQTGYVGYGATYAALITDSIGRDHLAYRGATMPHGCVYERRLPHTGWDVLVKLSHQRIVPGYTFTGSTLMVGPGDVVYCGFVYYRLQDDRSLGAVVLKSPDGGKTWTSMDGRPVALPLEFDAALAIAYEGNPHMAGLAIDLRGRLLAMTVTRDGPTVQTLLSRWSGDRWVTVALDAFMPDGWSIRQGNLCVDARGRILVVVGAVHDVAGGVGEWWGHPSAECFLLVSDNDGKTFETSQISKSDPSTPNWLPNISRNGPNHDMRRPLVIYTEGQKGDGCAPPDKTKVWAVWVD